MKIDGLDRFFRKLGRLKNIDLKPIVEDATARVKDEARKNVRVDHGELQNSITYKVEEKGNGNFIGTIFTNKEHGLYVELGTGPRGEESHAGISPEINPMYRPDGWVYYDKELMRFIYTKGQPAKPYLYPALHDNRDMIAKFIKNRVKDAIREAGR